MRLMEHFRTPRLIARDWTTDDAQAAFDIYGRDEVMRWLGAQPRRAVPSLTQMRERLDLMIQRASDEPGYGLWAVSLTVRPGSGHCRWRGAALSAAVSSAWRSGSHGGWTGSSRLSIRTTPGLRRSAAASA